MNTSEMVEPPTADSFGTCVKVFVIIPYFCSICSSIFCVPRTVSMVRNLTAYN